VTRERKTQALTAAVLLVAVGAAVVRKSGARNSAGATPQDTVYAMLDAARAGDVRAYLAQYTGSMATALRQTLAESNDAAFAKYLKESNAALKGAAVSEPEIGEREARLKVEYVYQDRNEAQTMYLEKIGGVWKIARAESGDRIRTLVPYGTPVR
jgi:hypothetical protein